MLWSFYLIWSASGVFSVSVERPADVLQRDVDSSGKHRGLHPGFLDRRTSIQDLPAHPLLMSYGAAGYYIDAEIGGKTFKLLVDTGSDWLWVFSEFVDDPDYAHKKKLIWAPEDEFCNPVELEYDDGTSVTGFRVARTVTFGKTPVSMEILGAAVVAEEENYYPEGGVDGMIGLDLYSLPLSSAGLFSIDFQAQGTSQMTFGDLSIDSTASRPIKILPGNRGHWLLPSPQLQKYILIDSAEAAVSLPESFIRDYFGDLNAEKSEDGSEWVVECSDNLPRMAIPIGTETFYIPGNVLKEPATSPDAIFCTTLIEQMGDGERVAVLGLPFVQQYNIVFDRRNQEVTIQKRPTQAE